MSLPTLEKRWQFAVNLNAGRTGRNEGDLAQLFLVIKNNLRAFQSSPWKVISSCNGKAMALGGQDLLEGPDDIVAGPVGESHSWIILAQPALGQGTYCFDFDSVPENLSITWSPGGKFLGGSTKIRPAADDELTLQYDQRWLGDWFGYDGIPSRAHVMMSEDGTCTRVFTATKNNIRAFWLFDLASNPTTGWTSPVVNIIETDFGEGEPTTFQCLWNGDSAISVGPKGEMALNLTSEGYCNNGKIQIIGMDHTMPTPEGDFPLIPIDLWHDKIVGQRGLHGQLSDAWWTSAALQSGTTFPPDGTKAFVVFGDMVFPWNGSRVELG